MTLLLLLLIMMTVLVKEYKNFACQSQDNTPHKILCGWSNREEWDERSMWHVGGEESCIQGFGGET